MAKGICWIISYWILMTVPVLAQRSPSVIITEIMADPTPSVGLPDAEYIELYNTTSGTVSLKGWKLILGTRSQVLPDSSISPGGYLIVCSKSALPALAAWGKAIGLNTFSLTNAGMQLALVNPKNQLVYALAYQNKWWPSDKKDGGYSLEMIDVTFPCGERENWQTTLDERGGTPGRENSVRDRRIDSQLPVLERVNVENNKELHLIFDKRMDSLNATGAARIDLSGRTIVKTELDLYAFRRLRLTLDNPLLPGESYLLTIRNISDCSGNILQETERTVALPVKPDSGDVIINEILFNPFSQGVDFVELYNKSAKYIRMQDWLLGNVRADGTSSYSVITENVVVLPAFGYLALTTDASMVKAQYPSNKPRDFLEMESFPSYPNASGGVLLVGDQQQILDRVLYNEKMHHPLLTDYKGVSLEKVNPAKPSSDISNWHSASSTSGFGTPGYANSQMKYEEQDNLFTVLPEAFSPDGDGVDDFASIHYEQRFAGMLATIRIYNTGGRMIRNLMSNQLMGTSGTIQWNGTDDQDRLVSTGYYFIIIDTFDTGGNTQQYKCKVVVANRRQ